MKSQNFKNSKRLVVFALTPGTSGSGTSSLTGSSKAEDQRGFDPFSIISCTCCVAAHSFVVLWQNLQRGLRVAANVGLGGGTMHI